MKRPDLNRVPQFYHKYINLVPGDDLNRLLPETGTAVRDFLQSIPEAQWDHRYAEGKWSIRELVLHIIDSERIFSYRALCIARGETASLPGFDENTYTAASKADTRTKESLIQELEAVQAATTLLFKSFDAEQLERTGVANNNSIQVVSIGFITVGHKLHHKNILQERYLQQRAS